MRARHLGCHFAHSCKPPLNVPTRAAPPQPVAADRSGMVLPEVRLEALPQHLSKGAKLIDLSSGMDYRREHVAQALWANRARLAGAVSGLAPDQELVLADRDNGVADLAALDLGELGFSRLSRLAGGPDSWRAAGLEVVATADLPSQADCIDYLFFVHDRHDDNLEAARRYLAWETNLVAQLGEQETAVFRMPGARADGI